MNSKIGELVILFDGHCLMCSGGVRFIYRRDPHSSFRFAAQQSEVGGALLREFGVQMTEGNLADSVVVVDRVGGKVWMKSAAVLVIAGRLGFPWWLAGVFWVVPRRVRDVMYGWMARNRYRWFGKKEACFIPEAGLRERFL